MSEMEADPMFKVFETQTSQTSIVEQITDVVQPLYFAPLYPGRTSFSIEVRFNHLSVTYIAIFSTFTGLECFLDGHSYTDEVDIQCFLKESERNSRKAKRQRQSGHKQRVRIDMFFQRHSLVERHSCGKPYSTRISIHLLSPTTTKHVEGLQEGCTYVRSPSLYIYVRT